MSNRIVAIKPLLALFLLMFLVACAKQHIVKHPPKPQQEGLASWYGPGFHGRRTASGEKFNMWRMTAAHKTLAFGTYLKVTNVDSGDSAVVKVTDRGPFIKGRVLDVSKAAAKKLGFLGSGTARVTLEEASADEFEDTIMSEPSRKKIKHKAMKKSGRTSDGKRIKTS